MRAILAPIHSGDLTPVQLDELDRRLRPMFRYLALLERRMAERQFDPDDRLYLVVTTARNAMQLLGKDVHRLLVGPSWGGSKR